MTIGLQRDGGGEDDDDEKTTVRSVPDGSDNQHWSKIPLPDRQMLPQGWAPGQGLQQVEPEALVLHLPKHEEDHLRPQ